MERHRLRLRVAAELGLHAVGGDALVLGLVFGQLGLLVGHPHGVAVVHVLAILVNGLIRQPAGAGQEHQQRDDIDRVPVAEPGHDRHGEEIGHDQAGDHDRPDELAPFSPTLEEFEELE